MPSNKKKDKNAVRFNFEERLALMRRIEEGETQRALAEETGVTHQYISLIWRSYLTDGPEALRPGLRGRKRRRKPSEEEYAELRAALENGTPHSENLSKLPNQPWTFEFVRAYIQRRWDFNTVRADIIPKLRAWGIPYATMALPIPEDFGEDFVRYVNSPLAKQIAEREKEYHRRWFEEWESRRPKRGRPRKNPPSDGSAKTGAPSGDDDIEAFDPNVDYAKLLAETQKDKAPAPGVRVGKHRKGTNRTKPKKRRKKLFRTTRRHARLRPGGLRRGTRDRLHSFRNARLPSKTSRLTPRAALRATSRSQELRIRAMRHACPSLRCIRYCRGVTRGVLVSG